MAGKFRRQREDSDIGFFDWLYQDKPVEGAKPAAKAPAATPPKVDLSELESGLGGIQQEYKNDYGSLGSPSNTGDAFSKEKELHVRKRAETSLAVIRHASDEIDKINQRRTQYGLSGGISAADVEFAKSKIRGNPERAAFVVEQLNAKYAKDIPDTVLSSMRPDIEGLEKKIRAYNEVVSSPGEQVFTQAALTAQDAAVAKQKLGDLNAELSKNQTELERLSRIKPVSGREEQAQKEQMTRLQDASRTLLDEIKKAEPAAAAPAPQDATPPPGKSIKEVAKGAGMDDDEIGKTALGILDTLRNGGLKIDTDAPVNFESAVATVIQQWAPELGQQFVDLAMELRPGLRTTMTVAGGQQKSQAEGQIDETKARLQGARVKLADAQELQSWPSVLAFVILSMVIGPRMAFLFFSNAREKGMLRSQIADFEKDIKGLEERRKTEEKERNQWRQIGAKAQLQWSKEQSGRQDRFLQQLYLNTQRAVLKAKASAGDDKVMQNYIRELNRMFSIKMASAAQAFRDLDMDLSKSEAVAARKFADEIEKLTMGQPQGK